VTEKYTILDVKATDSSGKIFTIEFQTCGYASFAERLLYYWARTYARQLSSGKDYGTLQPVVSIAVVGYLFFKKLPDIHNVFSIVCENDPRYRLTDDLQIHTLEAVPEKFGGLSKMKPALRRWIQFFYEADKKSEGEMKTLLKGDVVLTSAYKAYQQFNADVRLRAIDDAREQYLHDVASQKVDAFREGLAEGEAKKAAETAWKLKMMGVSAAMIAEATGLSAEEIKRLR
jgi:predicted transposase/invertase (TIGR01784 family)